MKWFQQLKVGTKIILGFSVMILFLAVIGMVGYRSLVDIEKQMEKIFAVNLPSIDYLIEADRDLQQLLVAERSMIFANVQSDVFKGLVEEYKGNMKQAQERWQKYKVIASTPEERKAIAAYEKAREEWQLVSKRVVDGRLADTRTGRREALDLSLGMAKEKFEAMRDYLDQLTELNLQMAQQAHDRAAGIHKKAVMAFVVVIGLGILFGIALMWGLGRAVTRPLKRVGQGLILASDQVSAGSHQLAASSQSLAEGASEQAAAIQQTSASIEELSSMTRANADNASKAKSMMGTASEIVARVNAHMGEMTEAISEINRSSEETSKIIKTIDEIAFQTNLLALNAAVEAARAGEAGAGFAVVADEVRGLAMRAAEAARNTSTLIDATLKAVENGNTLTRSTKEAFEENVDIAGKVAELVEEIAGASSEQAEGIEQLNKAISEMDTVVQRVAANAEESASSSEEMNAQSLQLKEMVRELFAMIGKATDEGRAAARQDDFHAPEPASLPSDEGSYDVEKNPVGRKTKESKAKKAIPLEDEDFMDF